MGRYLAFFEYDGTGFRGFQRQPGQRTVQGEIEASLEVITGARVPVTGAGRTDSGVHAMAMPAHFDLNHGERIIPALARVLPSDIALRRWLEVSDDFHCRFHARERVYRYRIGRLKSPLKARFEYQPGLLPDTELMVRAAGLSIGEGNWRGFAKTGGGNRSWSMAVREALVIDDGAGWTLQLSSDRFLRGVVRIWAGTLLMIGLGRLAPSTVSLILQGKRGVRAGPSLPARGLTLVEVKYDGVPQGEAFSQEP